MVIVAWWTGADAENFQYSLCRVVLMVCMSSPGWPVSSGLSVLALSSRFDGLETRRSRSFEPLSFSTRSVESF